jgi:hypothetical protein
MSLTRKKSYAVAFKGTQGLDYSGVNGRHAGHLPAQ